MPRPPGRRGLSHPSPLSGSIGELADAPHPGGEAGGRGGCVATVQGKVFVSWPWAGPDRGRDDGSWW